MSADERSAKLEERSAREDALEEEVETQRRRLAIKERDEVWRKLSCYLLQ